MINRTVPVVINRCFERGNALAFTPGEGALAKDIDRVLLPTTQNRGEVQLATGERHYRT